MIRCYFETKQKGRTVRIPVAPTVVANVPQQGMRVSVSDWSVMVWQVRGRSVLVFPMDSKGRAGLWFCVPIWKWRETILDQHMRGWSL